MYDTIVAFATPLSTSSVGIIRISGDEAIQVIKKIFVPKNKNKNIELVKSHSLTYGFIKNPEDDKILDEVLVSVMRSPNSYTTEDVIEINGHGGIIVMKKIINLILKYNVRMAEPGEFTKRAFLNGRIDLSQAEAVIDIINAKTDMAANVSINQLKGALLTKVSEIKKILLGLIAHIEASIDYPEYDIEELTADNILENIYDVKKKISNLLDSYDNGKIIKEGIKTVITGRPNVGKSSLLNALLREQRAIVTEIPGTTRDVLEEYMNIHGVPLRLIDTAGIRSTEDYVESIGINKAKEKIDEADLIICVVDASQPLIDEDLKLFSHIKDKKVIVLLNKIDLKTKIDTEKLSEIFVNKKIIPISILNNNGIELLENEVKDMFMHDDLRLNDNVYITNIRQKNALSKAIESVDELISGIKSQMPVDFLAVDLKNVYDYIGELTGDSVSEDLITEIFSNFCLGK